MTARNFLSIDFPVRKQATDLQMEDPQEGMGQGASGVSYARGKGCSHPIS
jgi:hypothetical protein